MLLRSGPGYHAVQEQCCSGKKHHIVSSSEWHLQNWSWTARLGQCLPVAPRWAIIEKGELLTLFISVLGFLVTSVPFKSTPFDQNVTIYWNKMQSFNKCPQGLSEIKSWTWVCICTTRVEVLSHHGNKNRSVLFILQFRIRHRNFCFQTTNVKFPKMRHVELLKGSEWQYTEQICMTSKFKKILICICLFQKWSAPQNYSTKTNNNFFLLYWT